MRFVDSLTIHSGAKRFEDVASELVPADARYIIFDLDRTFHLERNIGELLGWDIVAREAWGDRYHEVLSATEGNGRFILDRKDPLGLARYAIAGVRDWAVPGAYYGVWLKLAWANRAMKGLVFRRFGTHPVRDVQRIPQGALFHQMSRFTVATLTDWTAELLERFRDDLVITPEDIERLRAHAPDARLIISSASPGPVLEAARGFFGVDDVIHSDVESIDGTFSTPPWLHWTSRRQRRPARIAPLASMRINSGAAKLDELRRRLPDFDRSVTVGISDTDKGEDHPWAQAFTHLLDTNSSSPFPPLVEDDSPLMSIHSAALLSVHEQRERRDDPSYLDPRRRHDVPQVGGTLDARTLRQALSQLRVRAEQLTRFQHDACSRPESRLRAVLEEIDKNTAALARRIDAYNVASDEERSALMAAVETAWDTLRASRQTLVRVQRPQSAVARALGDILAETRASAELLLKPRANA